MRRASRSIDGLIDVPRVWVTATAHDKDGLEAELNRLSAAGYDIVFVLTEGPRDGFHFTIVGRRKSRWSDSGTLATRVNADPYP